MCLDIVILHPIFSTTNVVVTKTTSHDKCIQVDYISTALLAILLLPGINPPPLPKKLPAQQYSEIASFAYFQERDYRPLLPSSTNRANQIRRAMADSKS